MSPIQCAVAYSDIQRKNLCFFFIQITTAIKMTENIDKALQSLNTSKQVLEAQQQAQNIESLTEVKQNSSNHILQIANVVILFFKKKKENKKRKKKMVSKYVSIYNSEKKVSGQNQLISAKHNNILFLIKKAP
jgi:hypothetical protein